MRSFFLLALCCSNIVFASVTTLEEQLKQAIYQNNSSQIQSLLYQYQQQPQQDLTLKSYAEAKLAALQHNYGVAIRIYRKILSERPELNSIRMELAKVLFADRQDSSARVQFDKVKSVKNLPSSAYQLIERYIDALNSRNSWQFDASVSYLKTDNVENVSSSSVIENTGFVKGAGMLPQKAQGFAYNLGTNRDFNLIGSHYLGVSNETYGKIEYEKRRFFKDNPQAGNIRTASTTLIWYRNPEQIFYLGAAFSQQRLQERQYSSDIQNLRLGWLQEEAQPVVDSLFVYRVSDVKPETLKEPRRFQICWSEDGYKAFLLLNDYPHAVFDFREFVGYNHTKFPEPELGSMWRHKETTPELVEKWLIS